MNLTRLRYIEQRKHQPLHSCIVNNNTKESKSMKYMRLCFVGMVTILGTTRAHSEILAMVCRVQNSNDERLANSAPTHYQIDTVNLTVSGITEGEGAGSTYRNINRPGAEVWMVSVNNKTINWGMQLFTSTGSKLVVALSTLDRYTGQLTQSTQNLSGNGDPNTRYIAYSSCEPDARKF
jgi:hypothetical protein